MLLASASCVKFISSNNTDTDSESPAFPPRVVMNLILLTYTHHLGHFYDIPDRRLLENGMGTKESFNFPKH